MLSHVARFEWRYQLRSPVFWVGALIFFLMTFGSVVSPDIQIGAKGNVNVNSPFALLQTTAMMSVMAVFFVVAMVAGTVIRDDETGFAPIVRTTSVGKWSYLVGRYAGAVLAALTVLATVPLAVAVGSAMPWLDPEKVGAFHLSHYLYALFAFALPSLLVMSAGLFALATATRSLMWSYVGAVAALVGYLLMRGLLRDPSHDQLAALIDPFGLSALKVATKYWTTAERNTLLPTFTGPLLVNRVLWTGIALAMFAAACARFRFEQRTGMPSRKAAAADGAAPMAKAAVRLPAPRHDAATRRAQFLRLVRFDMAFIFRSPAFFVLMFIGLALSVPSMWLTGEYYGSGAYPVTRLLVRELAGNFGMIQAILAVFYAGELVWRDRDRRMHEIVDATSAPDWTHLVPKLMAVTGVLLVSTLLTVVAGMAVQTIKGYYHFDLPAYLVWFVVPSVVAAVQLAVLSMLVQLLVPQKFLGWGAMLLYIVLSIVLPIAGYDHMLYNSYGLPQLVPMSDMNRLGHFWIGQAWVQFYSSALALVFAVAAHLLWRRGGTTPLKVRLAGVPRRLHGLPAALLAVGTLTFAASGGWIFYNTNVLNVHRTPDDEDRFQVALEKQLLPFASLPQPEVDKVVLDVQLYPQEPRAVAEGHFDIVNRNAVPVDTLHVAYTDHGITLQQLDVPGATLQKDYGDLHYRIYRLSPPMQPGEHRPMHFVTSVSERGFPNSMPLTSVVENGTFLNNNQLVPWIGMRRNVLLTDRSKRRRYGLPPDLRMPKLEDDDARAHSYFDEGTIDADFTITTDADQTPMAPGYTLSDTTANGRRTVHFRPDAPMVNFYSIQSGRYEIRRDRWNGVDLAVYYHPEHAYNVDRMIEAMKASLQNYTQRFGPYQFRQARVIEFPAYADFAQSFANTIPYSENIGFIFHRTDPQAIDMVAYVTAHEMAHQWWGHQLVPANKQGSSMLVESFAQYSALLTMEQMFGREQVRRFTKYELDRYLRDRGSETVEEEPLDRVENQGYIHYRKGTLAMYWLREALGTDVVDRSMRKLLQQYAFKGAPYPDTRDFLRILRAEAGPGHDQVIDDLLDRITLLDLKATGARAHRRADGKYEVTLDVEAHKFYADGQGKQTESPMDEPVDVGVFTAKPGDQGFGPDTVLAMQRLPVKTGRQQITVVVDHDPKFAGIDPYNKRIDRNSDDNTTAVAVQ